MNKKNKQLAIGAGGVLVLALCAGGYFLVTKKTPEELQFLCEKGKAEVQADACADLCELTEDRDICLRAISARGSAASKKGQKTKTFNLEQAKAYDKFCDSSFEGWNACGPAAFSYANAGEFDSAREVLYRGCAAAKGDNNTEWTDFDYVLGCDKFTSAVTTWYTFSDPTMGKWAGDLVDKMNNLGK